MSIALIAAVAANRVIGRNNTLPWALPEDLHYFKRTTMGHRLIMGRNTFESLKKPLPGRQNVVVSRHLQSVPDGVVLCRSIEEALALPAWENREEVFCMGGAQLYTAMLPFAHRLYLTHIAQSVDGDAYFPEWSPAEWCCVSEQPGEQSSAEWPYVFAMYERIEKSRG